MPYVSAQGVLTKPGSSKTVREKKIARAGEGAPQLPPLAHRRALTVREGPKGQHANIGMGEGRSRHVDDESGSERSVICRPLQPVEIRRVCSQRSQDAPSSNLETTNPLEISVIRKGRPASVASAAAAQILSSYSVRVSRLAFRFL